ncbi:hypothetical protein FACS189437_00390 [Bacteroidia bacterium]|nr:hypothetical protein FACS189437_00390 [Bacteroidia bacterium]
MKKNLILMLLLLAGVVSLNAQDVDFGSTRVVVAGKMVNTGTVVSKIPTELRGGNAKVVNNKDFTTAGLLVGAGDSLINDTGATFVVGRIPIPP